MSRSSKRARQGKTKILISWGLLAIYALLAVFLLFLIFKYNMLAFRYLNIVVTVLIVALAILCFFFNSIQESSKSNADFITTWCVN